MPCQLSLLRIYAEITCLSLRTAALLCLVIAQRLLAEVHAADRVLWNRLVSGAEDQLHGDIRAVPSSLDSLPSRWNNAAVNTQCDHSHDADVQHLRRVFRNDINGFAPQRSAFLDQQVRLRWRCHVRTDFAGRRVEQTRVFRSAAKGVGDETAS